MTDTKTAAATLCTLSMAATTLRATYRRTYDLAHQGKLGEVVHISGRVFLNAAAVEAFAKRQTQEATL